MPGPTKYNPVTKVVTMEIPFLSLVTRADPSWARDKFWDVEYEMTGKNLYANPYNRGAFDFPTKTTNVSYASGSTFNAGDLTGQGFDFVYLVSQAVTPGSLITRTAAQMFGDISGAAALMQWILRIINMNGTSPLQIASGVGVTQQNVVPIKAGYFGDYLMTFTDASHLTMVGQATNLSPIDSVNPLIP